MSWSERLVRRPQAQRDIEAQVDYYLFEAGAPEVADRFFTAVENALAAIVEQPGIGAPCGGSRGFAGGT